ncbi:MAG TPA: formylmethanofuran dehydrogenase [Xanthobacteraceae bacterium]|nr:formylmethanofuran dehydrogenase [Xanthobacteraceae bacterium]
MAEFESGARTFRDVVCGFCGLGCDDLTVEVEGRAVRAAAGTCPEAGRLFARPDADAAPPRVSGEVTNLASACSLGGALLAASRAPLFAGLGTDIDGGRAVLDLAARTGGVLDHAGSTTLFRNYASVQRTGWLSTTLAEVRNRCDLLLVVGDDPTAAFGRLFERLYPQAPLFAGTRRVVFLGGAPGGRAKAQLAGVEITVLPATDPAEALAALVGLTAGRTQAGRFGGVAADDLAALALALKAAAYAVVSWNAGELAEGDLVAERATALVDALNATTRAGVFPLGGRDNIIGINQLLLWRLGYPLRTAIRGGISEHDPILFEAGAAARDADLLVWVSAFRPEPPPAFDGPVIVLGHPDTEFETTPDVFIPVGTPGIDHAGTVFRMDSIVSLPLGALRVATLPSVAEAVRRMAGEVA